MTDSAPERIYLSPPHMSGREHTYVQEAFDINFIAPVGPHLDRFEEAFCAYTGHAHAAALSSGTAAMHLALIECGVKPGDQVLASTLTFIGSVSPATFLHAQPVFIDCDEKSWNMDPGLLAEELAACASRGKLPAAVIPTDLYGQCADLDAILAACAPYGVPVIADSAEAMGARYKDRHAGVGARAAIYSFNGNKIITTGGGGMLASDDGDLIAHARFLSTQAREPQPWYEHKEIGFNYRLSNIAAAIGLGQLEVLDERVRRKKEIFERYRAALAPRSGIAFMPESATGAGNYWLTVVRIDRERTDREPMDVQRALEEKNIESRPMWNPMHRQPVFAGARFVGSGVSDRLFEEGLCLPSGTGLSDDQIDEICELVQRSLG